MMHLYLVTIVAHVSPQMLASLEQLEQATHGITLTALSDNQPKTTDGNPHRCHQCALSMIIEEVTPLAAAIEASILMTRNNLWSGHDIEVMSLRSVTAAAANPSFLALTVAHA